MELPIILAKGKFKPSDIKTTLSESNRKIDPNIESQLEAIWETKKKRADENGQVCYNGISYRLNSITEKDGVLDLDLGTFEYKVRDGLINIPEYFNLPEEYYRKGCFSSSTIKTSDNKYIMAELTGKSMNPNKIDFIGGIMDTDIEINNGYDIFESFYKELGEEANIFKKDITESYLQIIYLEDKTNIGFHFEVLLHISSDEIIERFKKNKDIEIASLLILDKEEYLLTLNSHLSKNKHLAAQNLEI